MYENQLDRLWYKLDNLKDLSERYLDLLPVANMLHSIERYYEIQKDIEEFLVENAKGFRRRYYQELIELLSELPSEEKISSAKDRLDKVVLGVVGESNTLCTEIERIEIGDQSVLSFGQGLFPKEGDVKIHLYAPDRHGFWLVAKALSDGRESGEFFYHPLDKGPELNLTWIQDSHFALVYAPDQSTVLYGAQKALSDQSYSRYLLGQLQENSPQ